MAEGVRWEEFTPVEEDVNWADFELVDSSRDEAEAKRLATQSRQREEQAERDSRVERARGASRLNMPERPAPVEERPEGAGVMWERRGGDPLTDVNAPGVPDQPGSLGGGEGAAGPAGPQGFRGANERQSRLREEAAAESIGRPTGVAEPISDAESLALDMGRSFGPDSAATNLARLGTAAAQGSAQVAGSLWGGVRSAAEAVGADTVAGIASESAKAAGQFSETDLGGDALMQFLQTGVKGATANAPSLLLPGALGVAGAGNRLATALSGFAVQSYGSQYQAGRQSGLDPAAAAARAAAMTIPEVATELIPTERFLAALNTKPGRDAIAQVFTRIAQSIGSEVPGEQMNAIAGFVLDKLPATGIAPDATMADLKRQLGETLYATVAQTGVMGAFGAGAGIVMARSRQPDQPTPGQMIDRAFRTPQPNIAALAAVEQQKRQVEDSAIMQAPTAEAAVDAAAASLNRPHEAAGAIDQLSGQMAAEGQARAQAQAMAEEAAKVAEEQAKAFEKAQKEAQKAGPVVPGRPPLPVTPVVDESAFNQPEALSTEQTPEPEQPARNFRYLRIADRTDAELQQGLQEARTDKARRGIQDEINKRSRGFAAQPQGLAQPSATPTEVNWADFTEEPAAPQQRTAEAAPVQPVAEKPAAPQQTGRDRLIRLAESLERRARVAKERDEIDRAAELMAEAEMVRLRAEPGMRTRAEPQEDITDYGDDTLEQDIGFSPKDRMETLRDSDLDSDTRSWSKQHGTEAFYDYDSDKIYVFADNIQPTVYRQPNGKMKQVLDRKERMKWVKVHEVMHRGFRIREEMKRGKPLPQLRDDRGYTKTLQQVSSNRNVSHIASLLRSERGKTGNTLPKGISIEEAMSEIGAAVVTGRWDELKARYPGVDIRPPAQYGMRKAWNSFVDMLRKVLRLVKDVDFSDTEVLAILKDTYKKAGAKQAPFPGGKAARVQSTAQRKDSTAKEMAREANRLTELVYEARMEGTPIDRRAWRGDWAEDLADWNDYEAAQNAINELRDRLELRQSLGDLEVRDDQYTEMPKAQVQDVMEAAARGEFNGMDDLDVPTDIPESAYTDRPGRRATKQEREKVPPAKSPEDYNVSDDRAEAAIAAEMNEALGRAANARLPAPSDIQPAEETTGGKRSKRRATPKNFMDTVFNNAEGDLFNALPKAARQRLMKAWEVMRGKPGMFELEQNQWDRATAESAEDATSQETARKAIQVLGLDKKYDITVTSNADSGSFGRIGLIGFSFKDRGSNRQLGSATMSYHDPDGGYRYYLYHAGYPIKTTPFYVLHTTGFFNDGVGKKFYMLANQIASMNNIPISPDSILTNVNVYRRTENMIAAALRFGDKLMIVPHKSQGIYGWNHRPANKEQYDRNLVRMLVASARNVQRLALRHRELEKIDQLRYLPDEDRFVMKDGSDGEALAKRIYELSGVGYGAGERWAGRTTVARMALTQAIIAKEWPEKSVVSIKKPLVQSTAPVSQEKLKAFVEESLINPVRGQLEDVFPIALPKGVLKMMGIYRPVFIDRKHVRHIRNTHPDVTPEDLSKIPALLLKPRAIIPHENGWRVFVASRDDKGRAMAVGLTPELLTKDRQVYKITEVSTYFGHNEAASAIATAILNQDKQRSARTGRERQQEWVPTVYLPREEIARLGVLLGKDANQLKPNGPVSRELRSATHIRSQGSGTPPTHPVSGQLRKVSVLSDDALSKFPDGWNYRPDDKDAWKRATVEVALPDTAPAMLRGKVFSTAPQVDTPAFKRWFKESAVVTKDGKPMLVYHSTNAGHMEWGGVPTEGYDFESFDTARSEMGTHFGTKDHANAFGKGFLRRVIPAYLSIQNPLRLKDYGGFSPNEVSSQLVDMGIINSEEAERIYDDVGFQYLNDQKFLQDKIKEAGYDGIVYLNRREALTSLADISLEDANVLSDKDFKLQFPEAQDSWIIFDRSQAKSPFNAGTFDAAKDDFLQSTAPNPLSRWNIPDESKWQATRRYAQDYMMRVRVVQDVIAGQGGTVNEANDVVGAHERMHGRIQVSIERLKEQFMRPLAEKLANAGLTFDELAVFAYAKHAPERNAHIATIRPSMQDGGSGMTNDDAQAIIDTAQQAGFLPALEDAHKDMMALAAATRRILLEEGLISQQQYDSWEELYENYIPLRGFEHVDDEGSVIRTGRGVDVRGKESLRALGRRSRAANLIENAIMDYERAIVRAEKNLVARTFAKLVQQNPDPTLWEIDPNRVSSTFDKNRQLVVERRIPDKGEDTIAYKENGDIVYVKVKDPLLMRALKRTYMDESGQFQHILAENIGFYNNWIRNTLTQYNPAFLVVNGIRDSQTGAFSALDTLGPAAIPKYTKHYASAMNAAWNMARKKGQNPEWDKWVTEFENSGAITGGFYMRDSAQVADEIRGMLLDAGGTLNEKKTGIKGAAEKVYIKARGSLAGKLAAKTVQFVEHAGQASENMSRLALYRTAREMGKTPAEAASIAKNGTVNFNTRGELGTGLNALYLFYNASVQGSARTLRALKNPYVQTAMAGMTAVSATLAALNAMWGGDDDDGVAYWDKVPDYEKERNLIIFNPFSEKKGDYFKIPAPYGFSVFNVIGYAMADTARWMQDPKRGKPPAKSGINIASAILGSYNPLGGALDPSDPVGMTMMAAPTILDLPIQIGFEVSSFGSKSAPPRSDFYPKPDSERVFLGDSGTAQHRLARWLNAKTGGSEAQSGGIDIVPATFETAVRGATGGVGTFAMDVVNTLAQMIDPVDDVQARNVPWFKAVYALQDERTTSRQFYENRQEIEQDYKQMTAAMKLGIKVDMDDPENKALLKIGKQMTMVNEFMQKLRKAEVAIIENDKMPETEKKARRKELAMQREKLMKSFNKSFNEVWGPVR